MSQIDANLQNRLRDALSGFWNEQLRIEAEGRGLALAMPLMDSSGWQVVLHLEPLTPTAWRLSDKGATLGGLDDAGKSPDGTKMKKIIEAQGRLYGFERNGLALERSVRFPFDPAEIQIFAEGLVALSHLCPKLGREVAINPLRRMEDSIQSYLYGREWNPLRHHKLAGEVEPEIVVDFYVEGRRPLALQPVGRQNQLRSYMEQWGWRWTDLGRAHPTLIKAMVYDPDNQEWDTASMRIGEKACDVFVPYSEVAAALDERMVA